MLAEVRLDTTAGRVVLPARGLNEDRQRAAIELQPSRLRVDVDRSGARASVELVTGHGRLELDAATTAALVTPDGAERAPADDEPVVAASGDASLTGRVRVTVPDLSFVSDLVPDVEDMTGRLDGDLGLAGTVAQPALTGSLDLTEASLFLPATGITIAGLRASLEGLGRDGVALNAAAESGDGEISLEGRLSLPGQPLTAELYLLGRDFQVMDNDDGQVQVSPDLTVTADDERIQVAGTVHVPAAELTPGAQAPSAVTASEDQVLVGPETDDTAAGRDLYAEVRLTLGDEVHFQGFGLTARFEGDVLVNQEPEMPTTATGELRILDGEYRAYGQGLVIERGRIYFAGGPVTEPALDVRAVRRPAEGILVGAHVRGTLESPTFELFSDPTMTQQQQLAWLVLGRSLEESPEGEGSALNRAALAMGLKGGDFLAKNIGEQIGVDDIGIETGSGEAGAPSDPSQAALVVGKYLSPKLYVSYGIGLFDPESVLEMQYEISNNWKLITQSSGDATGADIQYTVEVGGN